MLKPIITACSILLSIGLNAQLTEQDSVQIDSLKIVIKNAKHDTTLFSAWKEWNNITDKKDEKQCNLMLDKMDSLAKNKLAGTLNDEEKTFYLNGQGVVLYRRGVQESRKREWKSSINYLNQADSVFQLSDNYKGRTRAIMYIGDIYDYRGLYDTAITIYNKRLEIHKENNDKYGISYDLVNVGLFYYKMSDYGRALEYYFEGLELRKEINNEEGIAGAYNNIGAVYFYTGDYDKCAEYFIKALEIREKRGDDPRGLSNVYGNIGAVLIKQGDYEKSLFYLNKSLDIELERKDKNGLAYIYTSFGGVYYYMGEYAKARDYYFESEKLYKEVEDKNGLKDVYNNLSTSFYESKDYLKADEMARKSLKLAEELGSKTSIANSIHVLGNIQMDSTNYESAIRLFKEALDISRKANDASNIRINLFELGVCMLATDSSQQAGKYILELVDLRNKDIATNFPVMSETQKEKYFNILRYDYDLFYDYALTEGERNPQFLDRAYNNTLMLKGLLLKSTTAMRQSILDSGNDELVGQYYDWITLKRKIAKSYARGKDVSSLEAEANDLEQTLVKGSQIFNDIKKAQELDWKDVQKGLKKGEAAIEFVKYNHTEDFVNEEKRSYTYAALIIDHDCEHPSMIKLFDEQELIDIIGTFPGNNYSYINGVYGSKKQTKTDLYNLIWKPMEGNLKGVNHIYISPDGLLHKISFSALAKETDIYLCDLYKVESKSSTGKIVLKDDVAISTNNSVSLFGGINYNTDSTETKIWSYLEGSLTEVEKIEKILRKKKTSYNYYTAESATEDQFKEIAPESNILHIATHGYFYADPYAIEEEFVEEDESQEELVFRGNTKSLGMTAFVNSRNPLMRSGLAFAKANDVWNKQELTGEDGVLTAAEVATLDMRNTELVVLSACETGLGDIKGSEGVYGLQRSFKLAGVNYIIMSLWQVPDKETAEFMSIFYSNLIKNQNVSAAFIETQKSMREKYDPYFWAAFVLVQ